jgi:hypothetical protein
MARKRRKFMGIPVYTGATSVFSSGGPELFETVKREIMISIVRYFAPVTAMYYAVENLPARLSEDLGKRRMGAP